MSLEKFISKEYCKVNGVCVAATHKVPKKSLMGVRGNSLNDIVPRGSLFYAQFLKEFFFVRQAKNADTLLDLGCGEAVLLEKLRRNGCKCKYIGIDLSGAALGKMDYTTFKTSDAVLIQDDFSDEIPLEDSTATIVICSEVIEHFDELGGKHLLGEISRVLKPKGRLILTTSYGKDGHLDGHKREYTFNQLKPLVEERFSITEAYGLYVDDETCLYNDERRVLKDLKKLYPLPFLRSILATCHPEASRSYLIKGVKIG